MRPIVYECGICGSLHPWEWDGDCRDDSNRFSTVDEFALRAGIDAGMVEVRTMEERIEADSAE